MGLARSETETTAAKGAEAAAPEADAAAFDVMLEEAEAIIAELSKQYIPWLKKDLAEFATLLGPADGVPELSASQVEGLFAVAHNMKGQGTAFGYPMVSDIGDIVCKLTRTKEALADLAVDTLRECQEAIELVAREDIRGDGGQAGRAIVGMLRTMAEHAEPV
ncbi:MAG: hypothetical protein AAGF19_05195 [Pseudomonadota bacterium]